MFLSLLLLASTNWAVEFEDLTFVDHLDSKLCQQNFIGGQISAKTAYNKHEGHIATLVQISGENLHRLRIGERLYAAGSGRKPFAALVVGANEKRATVVVSVDVVDGLWADPIGSLLLFSSPDNLSSLDYRSLKFADDSGPVIRQKLSLVRNCVDEIDAD